MSRARNPLVFAAILIAACFWYAAAARSQSASSLEGTVLDQGNGPVPDADVTVFSDDRIVTTKADKQGKFDVAPLPAGARYLEASYPGFDPASVPLTDPTSAPLTLALRVGGCTQCVVVCAISPRVIPALSYEKRAGGAQLAVTVGDGDGLPLPYVALTLFQANLDAPLESGRDSARRIGMKERSFEEKFVARVVADGEGQVQFTDLDPGWYTLNATTEEGKIEAREKFSVARENLTKVSTYIGCGY